ncbi:MAG: hypothetical protein ACI4MF_08715 [Candidatus Faecivicinus sp.]
MMNHLILSFYSIFFKTICSKNVTKKTKKERRAALPDCRKTSCRTACKIGRGGVYGAPVFFRKRKRRKKSTFRQEIARKIVRFSDFRSSLLSQ